MRYLLTVFACLGQIVFAQNVAPTVVSGSPGTTTSTPQTFTFVGRDLNGAGDMTRMYFLVNTSPTIPSNVCHGFYDRGSNALYLYNDALTVLQGPLAAGGGGRRFRTLNALFMARDRGRCLYPVTT